MKEEGNKIDEEKLKERNKKFLEELENIPYEYKINLALQLQLDEITLRLEEVKNLFHNMKETNKPTRYKCKKCGLKEISAFSDMPEVKRIPCHKCGLWTDHVKETVD